MTTTDYNQQAKDLLNKLGIEFNVKFIKNDFHFKGDKDKRDIYSITLKRGNRIVSFDFGQSIKDSGFYYTMGRKIVHLDRKLLNDPGLVTKVKRMDYGFLNNGKSDIIHKPVAPNEYDLLACLTKYDVGTFENFCNDFGYDTDSRQAEKTYNDVKEEYLKVCTIFSDSEMEELQEIQ